MAKVILKMKKIIKGAYRLLTTMNWIELARFSQSILSM